MDISIKQFKIISTLEALSFLLLLGIAMPLKYIFEMPQMVQVVGMLHGILFIMYVLAAYFIKEKLQWPTATFLIVLLCSVLPFGPFYAERKYLIFRNASEIPLPTRYDRFLGNASQHHCCCYCWNYYRFYS